jgi:hypothetical protein
MRDPRIERDGVKATWSGDGSARLHLAGGVALLRPEEQASAAMLEGWRSQQVARRLAFAAVEARKRMVLLSGAQHLAEQPRPAAD